MTPQEQQMIDGLISRIRSTGAENKDTEADQRIRTGLAAFPDALYVLVQTVLVQQYGLEQAQAQLRELRQQVETLQQTNAESKSSSSGGSFLSHLFGMDNSSAQAAPQQPAATQPGGYQPVHNPPMGNAGYPLTPYPGTQTSSPPPPPYTPQGAYPQTGSGIFGGGGFLQGAMQTAAGVAAGEMMFRGMEDLFSGFGGHGRGFAGNGSETVIENNYMEGSRDLGRDTLSPESRDTDFYNPANDASRSSSGDLASGDSSFTGDDPNFGSGQVDDFADNDVTQDFGAMDDGSGSDNGGTDFGSDS